MNFQSLHFLVYLAAIVAGCGLLWRNFGARKNLLLAASYYFYMCWDWRFASLLLGITLLNYAAAAGIARAQGREGLRRAWLGLALAAGVGVLAYFKYANFFLQSFVDLGSAFGFRTDPVLLKLALPIGISFFTFQGLSYVIDVYRRQLEPTRDLRDFALFISFFPTVLAGPITRGSQLLPQLAQQQTVPGSEVEQGLGLLVRGFVKKIIFADVLAAQLVDPAFANPGQHSTLYLLLAVYAYSFQIYMDVSGYTDIARGSALLCGFRLPQNFNQPYLATSVSNFWQRWHISMSSFFRDYVFISLGGSRYGYVYLNLMLTFLAIGLWHGGGWNFLLYGACHGTVVCIERGLRKRRERAGLPARTEAWDRLLRIFWVFNFVAFTRILFRSPDIASAGQYVAAMFSGFSLTDEYSLLALSALALAMLLEWGRRPARMPSLQQLRSVPAPLQAGFLVLVIYLTMAFSSTRAPFVYFMF